MTAKENLRDAGSNVYNNDDVKPFTRKNAKALTKQSDISGDSMLNNKIVIYYYNWYKRVFANLVELQKHVPQLVTGVCKTAPNFCQSTY